MESIPKLIEKIRVIKALDSQFSLERDYETTYVKLHFDGKLKLTLGKDSFEWKYHETEVTDDNIEGIMDELDALIESKVRVFKSNMENWKIIFSTFENFYRKEPESNE